MLCLRSLQGHTAGLSLHKQEMLAEHDFEIPSSTCIYAKSVRQLYARERS